MLKLWHMIESEFFFLPRLVNFSPCYLFITYIIIKSFKQAPKAFLNGYFYKKLPKHPDSCQQSVFDPPA